MIARAGGDTPQRLQKVLAARGIASRRRAEELIAQGRVSVDGVVVRELGTRVPARARLAVDGRPVPAAKLRHVVLNKPRGVVSTARDERGRPTVVDLVGAGERLYPVGRLDADSEGLILLTNDGDWADRVVHPRYGSEREYEAEVSPEPTPAALERLRQGVGLEEGAAKADRVRLVARHPGGGRLRIVVHSGWKRQVRRMCAAVGLRVLRLRRVRLGPLRLEGLGEGAWRELSDREVAALAGR